MQAWCHSNNAFQLQKTESTMKHGAITAIEEVGGTRRPMHSLLEMTLAPTVMMVALLEWHFKCPFMPKD